MYWLEQVWIVMSDLDPGYMVVTFEELQDEAATSSFLKNVTFTFSPWRKCAADVWYEAG